MLSLSRLSFTDGNHPLPAFDLQRRDVMLNFDLFEPAPALTNLSREFFLVVILYALTAELLDIVSDPQLKPANLFLNCANRVCKTLARRFFQRKCSDLLSHIKPGSRQTMKTEIEFLMKEASEPQSAGAEANTLLL